MSSELAPSQNELVPSQRNIPKRAAVTAGELALVKATVTTETVENSATDAQVIIPAQGGPFQDDLPSDIPPAGETPNTPNKLADDPLADLAAIDEGPILPTAGQNALETWELVTRAQQGDKDAFARIYERYFDAIFRFVYFRVTNRQVAEDLAADTFVRALKRIDGVAWQGKDIGAWLTTIARNLVADHFKSGRYRFEVTGDVHAGDSVDTRPEADPEGTVLEYLTNLDLITAVQELNPEQRKCIVLRFLHGYSVAETAQAMGKTEGAIKALQYRAIRSLQRQLPEGFMP